MDQSISFLAEPGTVSIHLEEVTVSTKPLLHMSLQMYFSLQVSLSYFLCVPPANHLVDSVWILSIASSLPQTDIVCTSLTLKFPFLLLIH